VHFIRHWLSQDFNYLSPTTKSVVRFLFKPVFVFALLFAVVVVFTYFVLSLSAWVELLIKVKLSQLSKDRQTWGIHDGSHSKKKEQ